MKNHSTKHLSLFLMVFMAVYFTVACSFNEQEKQDTEAETLSTDNLSIGMAMPDSCAVDTSILTEQIDTTQSQRKIEAVDIHNLDIQPEEEDKKVGKAAGGSVGQKLQNAFNHISNDALDSREKRGIIKGIQKNFLDMREDRVFVTSIEGNKNDYGIGEYLRRLKGYEAIKVRIEKIQLAKDTLVANITVKEVKK